MEWLVICTDHEGALAKRMEVRECVVSFELVEQTHRVT